MISGTVNHVKFKRLARELGLTEWECVGVLESIWMFTARSHIRGDIGTSENIDIAIGIGWVGDEDALVNALIKCGWFEECKNNRIVVHDWHMHCPNHVKGNVIRHHKTFASESVVPLGGSLGSFPSDCPDGGSAGDSPTKPSPAKPSPAKPSPANLTTGASGDDAIEAWISHKKRKLTGKRLEAFKLVWEAFGYKKGRAGAIDAFLDIPSMTDGMVSEICAAAKVANIERSAIIAKGSTPIFLQGWISGRRWEDEEFASQSHKRVSEEKDLNEGWELPK
jgi:hypothetical protein